MTDENPLLTELNLFKPLIRNLHREGFYRLNDLRHLSPGELSRRTGGPGMKRLWDALGWDYSGKGKAKSKSSADKSAVNAEGTRK